MNNASVYLCSIAVAHKNAKPYRVKYTRVEIVGGWGYSLFK